MAARIAVFISGGGSNLQSIIDACRSGILKGAAEVALVVSSAPGAYGLARARSAGIPAVVISKKDHPQAGAFARALLEELRLARVSLICLAGYLQMIPSEIIAAYPRALLNIHPALLPRHGGQGMYGHRVHEAVLAAGDNESGPTVHFVDEEYDHGEIILQSRVPVLAGDTPEMLAARVLDEEHRLYPEAIRKVLTK